MTTFLTFADEAEAKQVLADYIYTDEQGNEVWMSAGDGWAMNVLGTVYPLNPNYDPEVDPPPVPFPGFGVNWSGELPEVCKPFVVEIANPVNVFF